VGEVVEIERRGLRRVERAAAAHHVDAPPARFGGLAEHAEALDGGRPLARLFGLEQGVEQPDGHDVTIAARHGQQIGQKAGLGGGQRVRATNGLGDVVEEGGHGRKIDQGVKMQAQGVVCRLIAQRVDRLLDARVAAAAGHGTGGVGPAEEQRDDIARRLLLRADLLIHEGLEGRHERGVLRAQAAAHRLAGDGLAGRIAARAGRRLHHAVDDGVDLPAGRLVLDHLALGDGQHDARPLEHRRQIARRDGEGPRRVVPHPEVEARPLLDGPQRARHRVDDDGGVGALELGRRGHDRVAHRPPAAVDVDGARASELTGEEVLDGVYDHLAVVVGQHRVSLRDEPGLQVVAVGDVAVVSAIEERLAAHHVGLRVLPRHGAERRPAHLAAEDAACHLGDAELVDHRRGAADALGQRDVVAALALDRRARRVVTAVLQRLQELGRHEAHVVSVVLTDEANDAAHVAERPITTASRMTSCCCLLVRLAGRRRERLRQRRQEPPEGGRSEPILP
jgi:hypothetical protein